MTDEPSWDDIETEYLLTDARIVATVKKGGAIVEEGLTLTIREGRSWNTSGDHDDPTREEWLEYHFGFHVDDGTLPESMVSQKAHIVINGTHPNGSALQIQGKDWIGYDERGKPEGNFYDPPKVTIPIGPDVATRLKQEARRIAASGSSEYFGAIVHDAVLTKPQIDAQAGFLVSFLNGNGSSGW